MATYMHPLKPLIKPHLVNKLNSKNISNFLPKLDTNTKYQATIWSEKTYQVNPESHTFTTIQEHFGNRLIKRLRFPSNAVILDIGCFIGEKLWQLPKDKKYLGIGIDISLPALRAAKKIDIFGHQFIAADLEKLPFKSNSVDLIMVFDVIEHLTHAEIGFKEVSRVLKPGGKFLLHIPIKDNKWSMFWWKQKFFPKAAKKDYDDVGHSPDRMLSTKQIKSYLKRSGMRLDEEIYYNSFFVHFWDREFLRIVISILSHFSKSKKDIKVSSSNSLGTTGTVRNIYGKIFVPILEIISFLDVFLSKAKIGNTYFCISSKR